MDTLPPPIQITNVAKYSEKNDPPMVDLKVTNPVTYFKKWIGKFLNNQDIDLRLKIKPFATIGLILAFGMVGGTFFSIGRYLFPNSSPIFHRAISLEGIIQKSSSEKYYLKSENNLWTLKPKPPITLTTLNSSVNKQVTVKGNLTKEANLVEVSEIILSNPLIPPARNASQPASQAERGGQGDSVAGGPDPSLPPNPSAPSVPGLPDLYPGLNWETTQKRVLIFTSGKRKIEQEGVYLESSQLNSFPQDFINYYIQEFKNKNFKETLNSINPEGITITYAKDNLFLTFGTKNIYQGSGDKKQLAGYKAYIEHN